MVTFPVSVTASGLFHVSADKFSNGGIGQLYYAYLNTRDIRWSIVPSY